VIADAIDVLTDLTKNFMANYSTHISSHISLYANYVASRTQEQVFLGRCDEIWATSLAEAALLADIAPRAKVLVVANSLDENEFSPSAPSDKKAVGFIGTYSSRPNLDAALFLAEQVFPEVMRVHPDARLKLAGANMPAVEGSRLRRLPFVDLLGAVSDSADLYAQCRIAALPVFVRGGVPLKLIEAMARQKPVVASPELAAALPVRDGYDLLVRDKASFARAISLLLSDDELGFRLARNGRETFLANWARRRAEEILRRSSVLNSSPREAVRG